MISFLLSRGEENQDFEFFRDVVKPMLQFSFDENDGTGAHLGVVGSDLHPSTASDNVVHLIFSMRLLRIVTPFRQHIQPSTHSRDAKKFEIEFSALTPLARKIFDVKKLGH
jgi:hypothetical protein